jgi:hypothetical protein
MVYGIGRRLRMMSVSYCGVFDTVAPDRNEPLPLEEMAAVSRDLNIIYINIRGALDNYAWCIYHERGMGKTTKLKDIDVGLFNKKFRSDRHLKSLKAALDTHDDWNIDLKGRRDPSGTVCPYMYRPRF